jgi:hypothetical protein
MAGVLICEGATLHQNGDLSISTTEFLATGVKVADGGTWLQLGRTTISAGAADGDFSLSTLSSPHFETQTKQNETQLKQQNSKRCTRGGQRDMAAAGGVVGLLARRYR